MGSDRTVTEWLMLRTALWRVGERPRAFEVMSDFRTANQTPGTSETASLERVDPILKHLDAFCAALLLERARARPHPAADEEERRQVHIWLEETQWKKMRLVAQSVLRQRYGSSSMHTEIMEDMFQEFLGLRRLDAVLATYDPLFTPLLGYVLFCFRRACWRYVVARELSAPNTGNTEAAADLIDDGPSPEQIVDKRTRAELVWRVAESVLSPNNHDAFRLRYQADLTDEQIGAQLGISRDAAKVRVNRALQQLKTTLKIMGVL